MDKSFTTQTMKIAYFNSKAPLNMNMQMHSMPSNQFSQLCLPLTPQILLLKGNITKYMCL